MADLRVTRLVVLFPSVFLAAGFCLSTLDVVQGQAVQLPTFNGFRPFVIGFEPVVGANGAVGGVSIDAAGIVGRADSDQMNRLQTARRDAMQPAPADVARASKLRKISLRRLEATIARLLDAGNSLPDEVLYLAGLQRAEFLFVFPEENDIVLAGFAEGWKIDSGGEVVGLTTGDPVLRLDDLLVALRTAEAASSGQGISCSIDPSEDGLSKIQRMLRSRNLQVNNYSVAQMEKLLGPQNISITGVPQDSHFARVMVGADFVMKRLAMNFERSPVRGMPSYLELLQASSSRTPRNMTPRWWLAVNYDPLLRSDDGLAWQLRGQGVRVLTEEGYLARGKVVNAGKAHPLAKRWADTMTAKYGELTKQIGVFGKLRNCMDLAVIAALILRYDLTAVAGYEPTWLVNPKAISVSNYHVPKTVASRASLVRKNRSWIVSVSGGVELDSWSVIENPKIELQLATTRTKAAPDKKHWWWD